MKGIAKGYPRNPSKGGDPTAGFRKREWSTENLRHGPAPNDDVSHTFTLPSSPADAKRRPSGLNARLKTFPIWPRNVRASRPVIVSQIITARSLLPHAR